LTNRAGLRRLAAMTTQRSTSLVPVAGHGNQDDVRGRIAALVRRFGDRAFRVAEEALGEDLEARIARLQVHPNEVGYDPFGFDPDTSRHALAVAALLHRRYFRTEVHGTENLPAGRALIVANHSGQLPIDGLVIGASLVLDAEPPRFPRSMVEKWSAQLPFVSVFFPRCGQVVGSPDNARRLLEQEETLVVFPEGVQGIAKPFEQRYRLANFGLGFMRLALETGTPIIPTAVIGGEEQYPSVADLKPIARVLGLPALPVLPQLLVGMWLPLPTKYRLYYGQPLHFDGDPDDDDAVMEEKVSTVQNTIQSMVNRGIKDREHIFF
jgi:1-acyl-sn-glycerol-3-phosphate acyltransferase